MNGWVKLHRKFKLWEWSDEPYMVSLFIHFLLSASNRDTKWKGVDLKRGQVIFGRSKWSKKTGISEQCLRTCIKKLKSTREITSTSTSKFTIITIVNYDEYQSRKEEGKPSSQPSVQPAINQQSTSNQPHREKVKNIRRKRKKEEESAGSTTVVMQGVPDFLG